MQKIDGILVLSRSPIFQTCCLESEQVWRQSTTGDVLQIYAVAVEGYLDRFGIVRSSPKKTDPNRSS